MEKMRTKDEIVDSIGVKKGADVESVNLRIQLCRLEVEIDKRDVLNLIHDELVEMNRLDRIAKAVNP